MCLLMIDSFFQQTHLFFLPLCPPSHNSFSLFLSATHPVYLPRFLSFAIFYISILLPIINFLPMGNTYNLSFCHLKNSFFFLLPNTLSFISPSHHNSFSFIKQRASILLCPSYDAQLCSSSHHALYKACMAEQWSGATHPQSHKGLDSTFLLSPPDLTQPFPFLCRAQVADVTAE